MLFSYESSRSEEVKPRSLINLSKYKYINFRHILLINLVIYLFALNNLWLLQFIFNLGKTQQSFRNVECLQ